MHDTVLRFDYYDSFAQAGLKMEKTPEGFLHGRAVVTNVGVFPYRQPDGSVRYELRPPEEVFKDEALQSLRGKPLTNDHPTEAVTPENAKDLAVGSIGDGVSRSEFHVIAPVTVTTADAIAAVEAGKRALSCGYRSKLKQERVVYPIKDWQDKVIGEKVYECPGVWMGVHYDAIQTDLVYNHVALVEKGRAGDDAVLRMDGAGVRVPTMSVPQTHKDTQKGDTTMEKLTLDNGLTYDAAPEVVVAFKALKKDLEESLELLNEASDEAKTAADAASKKQSEMQAELDMAKEKVKELEGSIAKLKGDAVDPVKLDAAVKARAELLAFATKCKVDGAEKLDTASLRRAILAAARPELSLDGKDQVYLDTAFDLVAIDLRKADAQDDSNRNDQIDVPAGSKPGVVKLDSLDEARAKYTARLLGQA